MTLLSLPSGGGAAELLSFATELFSELWCTELPLRELDLEDLCELLVEGLEDRDVDRDLDLDLEGVREP